MTNFDAPTKADLEARKTEIENRLRAMISNAETRANRSLTADETREFDGLTESLEIVQDSIAKLAKSEERATAYSRSTQAFGPASGFTVTREAGVYRPDGQHSFFVDMARASRGDIQAAQRLDSHHRQALQTRDVAGISSANGSGGEWIPPKWLEDQTIAFLRAGRVTADLCTKMALPAGTDTLNIPKVLSGTSTDLQGFSTGGQNTQISETLLTTGSVASGVVTIAGGQVVSMQLLEQSPANVDRLIFQDLLADYNRKLDQFVLNGKSASNQPVGILNVTGANAITYTSTTPKFIDTTTTANSFYHQLVKAVNAVQVSRFMPPTAIVLHANTWSWITESFDTTNRPLVAGGDVFNAPGFSLDGAATEGAVGKILGLPVYVDANMPTNLGSGTNETRAIVAKFDDLYLWESFLRSEAFPQTYAQQLSMFQRLYNYCSFQGARYPASISVVSGTGMITPALA